MSPAHRRGAAIAVLVAGVLGYAGVIRPIEGSIAGAYAALDDAQLALDRSSALQRRLPALEHEHALLNGRIAPLHLHDSRAALVDRFLHAIARTAQRDAVSVRSVAADPRATAELALDVTLHGPYTALIQAVRDLDSGPVAARIALTSLGNVQTRAGTRPQLDASFHVVLLRDVDEITTRPPHAV